MTFFITFSGKCRVDMSNIFDRFIIACVIYELKLYGINMCIGDVSYNNNFVFK